MKILMRGRQQGKTHELIEWVLEGVKTDSYPNWSRVLLVHNLQEADRLRGFHGQPLDYRQVFTYDEWSGGRIGKIPVLIAVDNAEFYLQRMLGGYHYVDRISINGDPDVDVV